MPNWCENELTITGQEGVLACLDFIRGEPDEEGRPCYIDFNKIVPMPEVLKGTTSPPDELGMFIAGSEEAGTKILTYPWAQAKGLRTLEDLRRHVDEMEPEERKRRLEQGQRALRAKKETGYYDWYEWCCDKWGTKWPAADTRLKDSPTDTKATICFSTAWSPPCEVVVKLSELYPALTFILRYWEGGMGFKGRFRVKAGKTLGSLIADYNGPRGG